MAIRSLNFSDYKQTLSTTPEKKAKYGEIFTPFSLIANMFEMLPEECFADMNSKWLDPGSGTGFFSMYLFWKLDAGLKAEFTDKNKRHDHIIKNMMYMVEIQQDNINVLKQIFGLEANIIHANFINNDIDLPTFNYVIGNPPYNGNGAKKVPTNMKQNKKIDGSTMWIPFIKKSISLLKPKGNLLMIVPSIWMKPDRAKTYNYLMNHKIQKLRCLTNTENNKIFSNEAQTPTCYFWLVKQPNDFTTLLYDRDRKYYIHYKLKFNSPIPVFGCAIVAKLLPFVQHYGHLHVVKTNTPKKGSSFLDIQNEQHKYPNIRTAILKGVSPQLVINYSNVPQAHFDECKLVLPHKMYGFPYVDDSGTFGISNRDNYVIVDKNVENLEILKEFFSTKTALYLFETTRYRMKYLEKYAFELIPDILNMKGEIKRPLTDESIWEIFRFDDIDKHNINSLHKKVYDFRYD